MSCSQIRKGLGPAPYGTTPNSYTGFMKRKVELLVLFSLLSFSGMAQEDNGTEGAAENATNPLAFVTKLQLQPNYTFKDNGGDQLILISRIIQPTKSIGLPFIKSKDPSKVYTIYRI